MKRKQGINVTAAAAAAIAAAAGRQLSSLSKHPHISQPWPKESIAMLRTPMRSGEKVSGRAKFAIDWLLPIAEIVKERQTLVTLWQAWLKGKEKSKKDWSHTLHVRTSSQVTTDKNIYTLT